MTEYRPEPRNLSVQAVVADMGKYARAFAWLYSYAFLLFYLEKKNQDELPPEIINFTHRH